MMISTRRLHECIAATCWLGLVLAVPALLNAATDEAPASVNEVATCVSDNAPKQSMRQHLELKTIDPVGDERTLQVKLEWKRAENDLSKVLLRVSEPPDLRGSAFLMIEQEGRENDLFSYLPELGRVRRVTTRHASGSLFGSDFSYEDVERLEHLTEAGSSRRLADAVIQGRPVYVLEGTPEPDSGSAYSRVVSYVDRERCVPLRIEFYEKVGEIRKVLEAPPEKAVKKGSVWIPTEISMVDRQNGTRSVMRVEEIEFDVEIPDRTFSQGALERRR